MRAPIHAAKTQRSKLIEAALAGEDVIIIIAHGGRPVVRRAPVPHSGFKLCVRADQIGDAPDVLAPVDEGEPGLRRGEGG